MLMFAFANINLFAKGDETPAAVKSKFSSLYPNATSVKWEKENGKYEASFKNDNASMEALFDEQGNLIESETEIKTSDLPKTALDYLAKNKPGEKVKEASKIVDGKGTVTYEAELRGEKNLIFDSTGNFIKEMQVD